MNIPPKPATCANWKVTEPSTLIYTLYKCPKSQRTIHYICKEFTLQENIKAHEIILTNAKCTSNLWKHPSGDYFHNECGVLKNYKENSSGLDYIWSVICQYFIECHSIQILIQPKTALNLILIECHQFIHTRHFNPISNYLKTLIKKTKLKGQNYKKKDFMGHH